MKDKPNKQKSLKVIAGTPDRPLVISDIKIPCYVLEDENRVLSQRGLFSALGASNRKFVETDAGAQIPRFAASEAINPLIDKELMLAFSSPILFQNPTGGGIVHGYPATILPDICKVVLAARRLGTLDHQQKALADRCETLLMDLPLSGSLPLWTKPRATREAGKKMHLPKYLRSISRQSYSRGQRPSLLSFTKKYAASRVGLTSTPFRDRR